ncbi:MAG: hypothetical protein ACYCVY_05080 [Acidiferrobacteraceae bacterium]|jgi:hypothetical protein
MDTKFSELPGRKEQILRVHADLIRGVVIACQNPALRPELESVLEASEANGWVALARAIRTVMRGSRDASLLAGLDDDDRVIVEAILLGLQDPSTLPPEQPADPALAVPGLSAMIDAAMRGDARNLAVLTDMAQQMVHVGGDLGRVGIAVHQLLQGERDSDRLTQGMDRAGRNLTLSLLENLGRLREQ